jgi:hypothetical protein
MHVCSATTWLLSCTEVNLIMGLLRAMQYFVSHSRAWLCFGANVKNHGCFKIILAVVVSKIN